MAERVLNYEQALNVVLEHARSLAAPAAQQSVTLLDAVGRVLAAPVVAPRDHPPFDRSTRDGYAVRAEDLVPGSTLRILGSLHAGESWSGVPLAVGQAIEIMTGAPLPTGANAVVMLEHVAVEGEALRLAANRSASLQRRTLRQNPAYREAEGRTGGVTPGTVRAVVGEAGPRDCGRRPAWALPGAGCP